MRKCNNNSNICNDTNSYAYAKYVKIITSCIDIKVTPCIRAMHAPKKFNPCINIKNTHKITTPCIRVMHEPKKKLIHASI